jgi:hypothetical protein
MKSSVNLELIFPVKDAPSASFMSFKASCLRDAGIITESEKQWVDAKVLSVLAGEMVAVRSGRDGSGSRLWRRPFAGAFSVLAYNILRAIISFVHSISEQDSVDDPTKRGANSLEPLPLVPSLSAARLVIVRSMNELEVRHPGRIPFVHDLSADYTPGDIAVAVG